MDLLKLKYFYTVACLEHVTKASEQLLVAQPAITKTIKLLEGELGVKLLVKSGRNIKLTEYGSLLKKRLDGVFSVLDELPKEIEQLKKDNGFTVKLNVLAASIAIMEAVVQYKNKYPEVVFNLIQNEEKSDCDISVTTDDKIIGSVRSESRSVLEENIYLAVPKNSVYAEKESVSFAELTEEKFIYL